MTISILSFNKNNIRGAEIWINSLKEKLKDKYQIDIHDSFKDWVPTDINIPINGRRQVLICRILTWFYRKPMIVFGHSGPGADDKWNLLCSPNVFVAFSDYQKLWAEKYKLPWTKVFKISHAVDLSKFFSATKKPNRKIVLCVAANDPDKRINLIREVVKTIPGAEFIAVGKGNPIKASFDEMPNIYKKADVFCFVPQPWEAFGLVFLEALASNLPVVTINDPIRQEIVGEAGIFIDNPENRIELVGAINKALKTNWGDKPRKQAEKFSWEKIVGEYEKLFTEVYK